MGALLAVGNKSGFGANENAGIFRSRISKDFHPVQWNISSTCDECLRIGRFRLKDATHENPQIADEHSQTRQHEKFRKLAPCDVSFFFRFNRKFFSPERVRLHPAAPTCNPRHRQKSRRRGAEPSCKPSWLPVPRRNRTFSLESPAVHGQFGPTARKQAPGSGKPLRTSAVCQPMFGHSTCHISSSVPARSSSLELQRDRRGRSSSRQCILASKKIAPRHLRFS